MKFHTPWSWDVPGLHGVTQAFAPGVPINVTSACAAAALKAGVGERCAAPPKGAPAGDGTGQAGDDADR